MSIIPKTLSVNRVVLYRRFAGTTQTTYKERSMSYTTPWKHPDDQWEWVE